jgi:tetratricopeptide (TPR) repeat protein
MYLVRRAQESVRARRWEDARLWLTEASDVDATNPWAYHLLGLIAFDRRDYVQAEALFQKASLHFRDAGEWEVECALLRGIAAEHVGRWYAARDAFQQAARLDPQNARAKRGLGNALRRIERLERRK